MTILTAEQRQAVQQAGDTPILLEDPETHINYVLLTVEAYERVRQVLEAPPVLDPEIPEGVRRSQDAFFRDLPELLKDDRLRGRWVAYRGEQRVEVGRTQTEVIQECNRRGLREDEYDVFVIEPQGRVRETMDRSLFEFEAVPEAP